MVPAMASKAALVRAARDATATMVKVAAAGADRVRPPAVGVTILIYHRVGAGTASSVDLSVSLFRRQMAHLAAQGTVITLDAAVARLTAPVPCGEAAQPAVVITFDDGTSDWVEHAMPVLADHGLPATFYVATSFVDECRPWPGGGEAVSWSGLADMASTGLATIGSHTHAHALLDRVDASVAAREVDRSADLIEEKLGRPCAHFAYPKALLGSPAAQAAVQRRFTSAALAIGRVNVAGSTDPYRLCRTPIQIADGMRWFQAKAAGGLRVEGALRERASGSRYADSVT